MGLLWLGGQQGHAMPHPCPCWHHAWESTQGKLGFLLLSTSPRRVCCNMEGFLPWQRLPSHADW